jgi:hypothetical protein
VGNPFSILWVILKAFSVSHFTLLYSEEMFKSPGLQMMNTCSLFSNDPTFQNIAECITGGNISFPSNAQIYSRKMERDRETGD